MLTDLERDAFALLLDSDRPVAVALRAQLSAVVLVERAWTGVGFFTDFLLDDDAAPAPRGVPPLNAAGDGVIGGVDGQIGSPPLPCGFLLFVRGGLIAMLEGYACGDEWPEHATPRRLERSVDGPFAD